MRAPAALLSACALVLSGGCGESQEPLRTIAVGAGATVRMDADEYRFDPGRLVVAGETRRARLRIVLANTGSLAHNIHVRDGQRVLASTPSFKPGGRRSVAVRLAAGRYNFLCTVADHEELGMQGIIEVR